uniref:Uncharacterized protein n=1 Tax=Oryza glumipatula TaxID=40148 RepID=A0A0D9Z0X5_9ORYZ
MNDVYSAKITRCSCNIGTMCTQYGGTTEVAIFHTITICPISNSSSIHRRAVHGEVLCNSKSNIRILRTSWCSTTLKFESGTQDLSMEFGCSIVIYPISLRMRSALSSPAIRFPSPNCSRLASIRRRLQPLPPPRLPHLFLRRDSTAGTPSLCFPPLRRSSTAGAPIAAPSSSSPHLPPLRRAAGAPIAVPSSSSARLPPLHRASTTGNPIATPPLCVSRDPADWKPPVRISSCFQSMSSKWIILLGAPHHHVQNQIRDQPIRQKLADKLVPPGTSEWCNRTIHHLRELRWASTSVAASSTPVTTFARPRAPPPPPRPRAPPRLHGRHRRSSASTTSASTAVPSTQIRPPPHLRTRRRLRFIRDCCHLHEHRDRHLRNLRHLCLVYDRRHLRKSRRRSSQIRAPPSTSAPRRH